MPRLKKVGIPGQLSLLDLLDQIQAASALPAALKRMLAEDLTKSSYPRDQVAARMSALLGLPISKAQLDAWTAPTKPLHRFPVEYLPAFVEASGRHGALRLAAEAAGCRLVVPAEVRAELARVEDERKRLVQRERVLRGVAEAMDKGVLG